MRRMLMAAAAVLFAAPMAAQPGISAAHMADPTPWSETYADLMELLPRADPQRWRTVEYRVSRKETAGLQRDLGFTLEPEDLTPEFFVAHADDTSLLGVAMFVEPHGAADGHAAFTVGVAVDSRGRIASVEVYDDSADALSDPGFLRQLQGLSLASSFDVGGDDLCPVEGHAQESQLVANAAREALVFMKLALGRTQR